MVPAMVSKDTAGVYSDRSVSMITVVMVLTVDKMRLTRRGSALNAVCKYDGRDSEKMRETRCVSSIKGVSRKKVGQ